MKIKNVIAIACWWLIAGCAAHANTIVQFDTSMGNFDVGLNDDVAPVSVANFLAYVTSGAYNGTIVHRSAPGFVVQGGGYNTQELPIPAFPPIIDETPATTGLSNVRGTIGVARPASPDSGTSQWYVNLGDNSALDTQEGGWAVFGHVLGDGMNVIDGIAALPIFDLQASFGTTPLRNYTQDDFTNGVQPTSDNFVVIQSVTVVPEPGTLGLSVAALFALSARLFWRGRATRGQFCHVSR